MQLIISRSGLREPEVAMVRHFRTYTSILIKKLWQKLGIKITKIEEELENIWN